MPQPAGEPDAGLDFQYGQILLYAPWGNLWFPSPPSCYDWGPATTMDTYELPLSFGEGSPTQGPE